MAVNEHNAQSITFRLLSTFLHLSVPHIRVVTDDGEKMLKVLALLLQPATEPEWMQEMVALNVLGPTASPS